MKRYWWLLFIPACGQDSRLPAEVPPSDAVQYWARQAGRGLQDCGQSRAPRGDTSCTLQKVHECLHAALTACRPAQGVSFTLTGEGDTIRTDAFVIPRAGTCVITLVEDRSADPLAKPPILERECRSASWAPSPGESTCQELAPIDCGRAARSAATSEK